MALENGGRQAATGALADVVAGAVATAAGAGALKRRHELAQEEAFVTAAKLPAVRKLAVLEEVEAHAEASVRASLEALVAASPPLPQAFVAPPVVYQPFLEAVTAPPEAVDGHAKEKDTIDAHAPIQQPSVGDAAAHVGPAGHAPSPWAVLAPAPAHEEPHVGEESAAAQAGPAVHAFRPPAAEARSAHKEAEEPPVTVLEGEEEREEEGPLPSPTAPGMEQANLAVHVNTDPKLVEASHSDRAGLKNLMRQTDGTILGMMARDGWEVGPLSLEHGTFALTLPAVRYDLPVGSVSIPPPRFTATIHPSREADEAADYEERMIGDLVLENGDDILTVSLAFPFNRTFSISSAGWARCRVGRQGGCVRMQAEVMMGLQVPKVPGLTQIMEFFVKNYANKSTRDCGVALSKGAAELRAREKATQG